MTHRTFIIPGDDSHLATIRDQLTDEVCGIFLHVDVPESVARRTNSCPEKLRDRIITFDSLTRPVSEPLPPEQLENYDRCLRAVLRDERVHYLATRTYMNSPLNNTAVIERIVANTLRIVAQQRPTRLLSSSTPHSVQAWTFARCFEEIGLPVFILERTPINNRAWIYRGLDGQRVVERSGPVAAELTPYTRSQVEEQVKSVAGARDARGYLVSRMDLSVLKGAESNEFWSPRREFGNVFGGSLKALPLRFASSYLKHRIYRSYQQHATARLPDAPFVIYFMHYQPERSSLPEALFHTQQLIALRQLANTLPAGWKLLVREHPSMWLLPLDLSVRTADYYEQIVALPNTALASMEMDTFELIDRSAAVSTLTGSVGFQALLRGKPAMVFGLPAYKDHPACITVATMTDVARAFDAIRQPEFAARLSVPALENYLRGVERDSIVADPHDTQWLSIRTKNFAQLYREVLHGEITL
jgi:hypothetical protein